VQDNGCVVDGRLPLSRRIEAIALYEHLI